MRTRLVIPAALLVAAAYMKGRRDEGGRPFSPPACELSDEIRLRAEAEAADAMEILGERAPATPVRTPGDLAGVVRALVPVEPVPPVDPVTPAGVVARAEAEVAAVASPPAPRGTDVFDPWVVPEFPLAARARRPRPPAPVVVVPAAAPAPVPAAPVADVAPAAEPVAVPAGPDLATVAEWSALPAPSAQRPAPAPAVPVEAPAAEVAVETLSEWATHVVAGTLAGVLADVPAGVEVLIDESGRFSLGGWAAQAGHMALCGVTFRDRRAAPVDAAAIRLVPDGTVNVADGGLVVLGDAGFAPDVEGFTLLVAAAGPGAFAATGRYEVVAG